jgi:hypothetical protein
MADLSDHPEQQHLDIGQRCGKIPASSSGQGVTSNPSVASAARRAKGAGPAS